ncbi:TonB-dependent receptor [Silvibacterium dinghuense]|uniref:TonB-dependent receptor n=1 Tax=Silvibacterium dinghuense TaxID=1560006 RepID=A0A4Q1SGR4_9BACT|nr:TonB-dependent receptor [Silvibacterium dinghuense]RXS96545.1 TonB-dependent receptor [Silvibacterium dinghuense]GGG91650.1 TonB-dependent receptor [Silvibacterium dinghuense]
MNAYRWPVLLAALTLTLPAVAQQTSSPASTAQTDAQSTNTSQDQKISTSETVTVTAPGETRDTQSVDSKVLLQQAPGTSPIAVLGRLPSVEVTTADPYGAYEWALRISVRGFNQNQLGFTLDDVPLGDMSYGNLNGLHISRAIIDEDMGRVTLSQGTGALEVASTSNLGGAVQFYSADPLDKFHFDARQSFGSFDGVRSYGRLDSGLLPGGGKFYFAGVWQRADKWKSAGQRNQRYEQFNLKYVQPVGANGTFTAYADLSNRQEVDYQDLDKIWVKTLGYNWDNFGNWNQALQAAEAYQSGGTIAYPNPVSKLTSSQDPEDAAYFGASGLRRDRLAYVSYKTAIGTHLFWKTTAYGHGNDGDGLWFTPYLPTYNSNYEAVSPISLRTSEYGIERGGFLTSLSFETAKNMLEGGAWFEKEDFTLARRFYNTSLAGPIHSLYDFPTNPFYTQWAYEFPSTLYALHLQDKYKINDKVTVSAGFKAEETNQTGNLKAYNTGLDLAPTTVASSYAQGSLESGSPFLPQVGVDWKLDQKSEVFADVAKNTRAYQTGGPGFGTSPWGTSQAGFDVLTSSLKPESSWSEEVGYRYTDNRASIQANYFHVNFSNRLLAIQQGAAIAGDASLLSNVGGVTTNGLDGAASVQFGNGWVLYNGLTFSRSTYNDNYTSDGTEIETGGKIVVDAPEFMWKNSLSYSHKGFDAHIGSDYMSKRYYTYTDDSSVDGRFLAEMGTSYHKDEVGIFDQLKLQFNIYNLANAKYYSTIGTNGFIASDPTGVGNNTLQVGAPRAFTGTFSMRF